MFLQIKLYFYSYASPLMYRPPEGICNASGNQAVVNGFQYDVYTIGMLCLELFTEQAFGHSQDMGQIRPRWTADLYPKIFDILQVGVDFIFEVLFQFIL